MIRQGRAESSKPCSVVHVSDGLKKTKKEWLDSRLVTKPLVYCIVKIEAFSHVFHPSLFLVRSAIPTIGISR
jgi:hypothetical protein